MARSRAGNGAGAWSHLRERNSIATFEARSAISAARRARTAAQATVKARVRLSGISPRTLLAANCAQGCPCGVMVGASRRGRCRRRADGRHHYHLRLAASATELEVLHSDLLQHRCHPFWYTTEQSSQKEVADPRYL